MKPRIRKFLILLIFFAVIQPGYGFLFVESDFRLQIQLPRAWDKKVMRDENSITIRLTRNEEAEIILTAFKKDDTDLDREIESKMDRLNIKNNDLKVLFEKKYTSNTKGYNSLILLLIEYHNDLNSKLEIGIFASIDNYYWF